MEMDIVFLEDTAQTSAIHAKLLQDITLARARYKAERNLRIKRLLCVALPSFGIGIVWGLVLALWSF